ncbi:hypothetical protein NEMBOFW57_006309 [Staphylotrichum longicolle]|uniref:Uncharacterized protein n=1 Tax=Staphylotrichum longicolle TaxID=669026 RepID=A0AAD4EYP1_9PEZI|nr:hypothetical protein NEMBOFW57_006309 [Staphylotrichum longicolle]
MRFTALLTSAVAGLAVAFPAARPDQSSTAVQPAQERELVDKIEGCPSDIAQV